MAASPKPLHKRRRAPATVRRLAVILVLISASGPLAGAASEPADASAVSRVIGPLMQKWAIPGMAVGLTQDGRRQVFTFGVSSLATRAPVTAETLFEVGSITKTFTATLAAFAEQKGVLAMTDPVARFVPELQGTPFGAVEVVHLGTHTPGGLPLQVPSEVGTREQMLAYFRAWRPAGRPGTVRTYSNPGIGALGLVAARSLGAPYGSLVEGTLLPALGLQDTFLRVPAGRLSTYAQGYTAQGEPVRLTPGYFWEEAYGIRTTAGDLLTYLEDNMDATAVHDPALRRALQATHTAYFRSGALTQDLVWEQYPMPVALGALLAGNASAMIYQAAPATALNPPPGPTPDVWINKTGSTAGFSAYVAFIPSRRLGIVVLANRSYPIPDRVTAAYALLAPKWR